MCDGWAVFSVEALGPLWHGWWDESLLGSRRGIWMQTRYRSRPRCANPGLGSVTPKPLNVICHCPKSVRRSSRMPETCLTPKESNPSFALGSCLKAPLGQCRGKAAVQLPAQPQFSFLSSVPVCLLKHSVFCISVTGPGTKWGWLCSYLDLQNWSLIHPAS